MLKSNRKLIVARAMVEENIRQLLVQQQHFDEMRANTIRALQELSDAWMGADADALAFHIQQDLLPRLNSLIVGLSERINNLRLALDIVSKADSDGFRLIAALDDQFRQVN